MDTRSDMELTYRQVSCQKAVSGTNFNEGVQDYNFSIGGRTAWIPNKSYFRIGMKLTGAAGTTQPTFKEQVAFADSACGNLYNNVYFRAGGQDVSSIVNYAPQASAIKNRLDKTGAWINSVGRDAFLLDPDFQRRVKRTASDAPAQVGDNLQMVNLGTAGNESTYGLAIAITGIITGTNTVALNTALPVGSEVLVEGQIYTVVNVAGATVTVAPAPAVAVDTGATGSGFKVVREANGDGRNTIYCMYQPPIGIFDVHTPQGSGDYRLQLNPNAYYKTSAVQMPRKGVAPTNFDIEITSVELYVATCKMDIPTTGVETLHLMEMQCQSKTVTNSTGDNLLDFTVPASTKALTVFVQSSDSGTNTQVPPSLFKVKDGSDTKLNSIQIQYANQVKPSTRWTSEFTNDTNKMTQRYLDTQFESGKFWSSGGTETFGDYIKRGPYYHYGWVRDKDDRSTQVQLSINYAGLEANANVFVIAHYTRTCEISVSNGFITDVNSLSI